MAEGQMLVASAVIVPDTAEELASPLSTSKRRQSSVSEIDSKRLRLSEDKLPDQGDAAARPPSRSKLTLEQKASGQLEERKRGKRLFGALLGTLAQSSSSTAQKRRIDIEKKQQEKLKLQAEEHDEKKKQRLNALMEIRRQEQKKYDKQSMRIRHSNLLAFAHFLQTKAEPKLYYKPYDLFPEEEAQINSQIIKAKATVEREAALYDSNELESSRDTVEHETDVVPTTSIITTPVSDTVGQATNNKGSPKPLQDSHANDQSSNALESALEDTAMDTGQSLDVAKSPKEHVDDGGDVVVEGDEDTVIY